MKLTLAALMLVIAATAAARADIAKKCPAPLVFVPGEGCQKPPPPKATPADPYYKGLAIIDSDPKRGFALYEESCKKGHGPACTQIGLIYLTGRYRIVPRDVAKATAHFQTGCDRGDAAGCQRRGTQAIAAGDSALGKKLFDRACTRGDGVACAQLAYFTERGGFGKEDPAAAKVIYARAHKILAQTCPTRATAKHNGWACQIRGYLYEQGYGVAKNAVEAQKSYELACNANNGDACYSLAGYFDKQKVPEKKIIDVLERACVYDRADACSWAARRMTVDDPKSKRAVELAERACQLDTKECGILADLYRLGRGTKEDQSKATSIFKQICEAGDHSICVTYAKRLHDGVGTKADTARAITVLEDACKADDAEGCEQLSVYLSEAKDDARGYKMAVKACTLKSAHGCFVAGWMVQFARRGEPKQSEADAGKDSVPFYDQACELGSAKACSYAGDLYKAGTGVAVDKKKAFERFNQGCDAASPYGEACTSAAQMALSGDGVDKDKKKAVAAAARGCVHDATYACEWLPNAIAADEAALAKVASNELAPACSRGNQDVCFTQASVLLRGDRDDKQAAVAMLVTGCGKPHHPSCVKHADAVYYGLAAEEDKARGEALYKRYCDDGIGGACFGLAGVYSREKKDPINTLRYADLACTLKNADGCTTAGYQYYTAQKGIAWNITTAATYYAKSCELKSAIGCANHAELLRYGISGAVDHAKAYELYQRSCDGGAPYGCEGAGYYVWRGEGGAKRDVKAAHELYKKACDAETAQGCVGLADLKEQEKLGTDSEIAQLRVRALTLAERDSADNPMYAYWVGTYHRDGMATAKNPAKALTWFVKACEGYDPLGCVAAGESLAASSKPDDVEQARVYFQRACAAGITDGCTRQKQLGAAPAGGGGGVPRPDGPPPVKAKGCACSGEIAPGAESGLLAITLVTLLRRRRRAPRATSPT